MSDSAEFPNYEEPPVNEVAIGLQYAPLTGFLAPHVGLYWDRMCAEFPEIEEQPPIQHVVEAKGGEQPPSGVQLNLMAMAKPPLPRTWLVTKDGRHLIQVQRDRFLYNWRKRDPADKYVRFPPIKERFFKHWKEFCNFLTEYGLSDPAPDQCELTYVNRINHGEGWNSMADLGRLFTNFTWRPRSGFLPDPENLGWNLRFRLPDEKGRLHVGAVPVRADPGASLAIRFSLTARGAPRQFDEESISAWFDTAHEWIVKGFVDLVTQEADTRWRRQDPT